MPYISQHKLWTQDKLSVTYIQIKSLENLSSEIIFMLIQMLAISKLHELMKFSYIKYLKN